MQGDRRRANIKSMSEVIVVVSGLPRSGTSLVMQMLAAGGVEALTDARRSADEDNPKGYYELEAVKRLATDNSWIPEARGKAIKVISHLIPDLPDDETYRIIVVERDLNEVLASQAKMIQRAGRVAPDESAVRRAFEAHGLAFDQLLKSRPEFRVLHVGYADLVATPAGVVALIAEFIGFERAGVLDTKAMEMAIDPTLYRNRLAD